ncbi:hypothetical protein ACFQZZ_23165 [Nocardia sp. GCM10030253]|uniref:hypothetical protein n=1 Tax=Nocardia sp. GCM10030253 TaxID=3273404 RepID=UPI00362582FA
MDQQLVTRPIEVEAIEGFQRNSDGANTAGGLGFFQFHRVADVLPSLVDADIAGFLVDVANLHSSDLTWAGPSRRG